MVMIHSRNTISHTLLNGYRMRNIFVRHLNYANTFVDIPQLSITKLIYFHVYVPAKTNDML